MSVQSAVVQLQDRDIELFRGLYECRVMTIDQIALLYFEGKREMARKRVTKLKSAGFVAYRAKDAAFTGAIVTLGKLAHEILEDGGYCDDVPRMSWQKLQKRIDVGATVLTHELEVVDVKVAFTGAIRSAKGYAIPECSTWPALHAFETFAADGEPVSVYPDGYMRIERIEPDAVYESSYFIEVDRSTERLDRIVERCVAYREHYRTGGFAAACGHAQREYRDFYFRVLITCKSAERRNNIALRLLNVTQPIRSQVWLTTHDELMCNALGSIWVRPADYDADTGGPSADGLTRHALLQTT